MLHDHSVTILKCSLTVSYYDSVTKLQYYNDTLLSEHRVLVQRGLVRRGLIYEWYFFWTSISKSSVSDPFALHTSHNTHSELLSCRNALLEAFMFSCVCLLRSFLIHIKKYYSQMKFKFRTHFYLLKQFSPNFCRSF